MFKTLRNAWRQPELKHKLLFTAFIIIIYRLCSAIPVPYFVSGGFDDLAKGTILEFFGILSGGAFAQGTLLALSVSPYITASIVMQLLTVAIPKLGEKAKQGEEGKKFINFWTRIVTIILAVITAFGYALLAFRNGTTWINNYERVSALKADATASAAEPSFEVLKNMYTNPANGEFGSTIFNAPTLGQIFQYWGLAFIVMVLCYCAGAAIVMWLAEKINESGLGNGISIILFANIVAGIPSQAIQLYTTVFTANGFNWVGLVIAICFIIGILGLLLLIVWMSDGERRIQIQYAKRVVGRKMFGGQSTNLPIKVNMSGVMPIIFANSIVAVPATIAQLFFPNSGFATFINNWFNYDTWAYFVVFFLLLIAFAYFYVAISFDPVEVGNNIKNNGGAILGIRPGAPTVAYIKKVLGRITLLGALLVAVVACVPMLAGIILSYFPNINTISAMAFGGSSMMIVIGVAIETMRDLEAQLSLRNYKGFLD